MNKVVAGAALVVVAVAAYTASQRTGVVAPKTVMEQAVEAPQKAATETPAQTAEATADAPTPTAPLAANALLQQQPYDRVLGNAAAPVTIVEYSSLSCPHCADFHEKTLPEIKQNYVDTGKVRFLVRPFALNESALRGSQLTFCVPNEKYHAFLEVLFSMQQKWAMTLDYKDNLKRIAQVGGVSDAQFEACVADTKLEEQILNIRKEATENLDIKATPTFFINGEKVQGDTSVAALSEIIDAKLKALEPADSAQ
jgi:protein-disulfide isomerase